MTAAQIVAAFLWAAWARNATRTTTASTHLFMIAMGQAGQL